MPEVKRIELGHGDGPVVVFAHGWDRTGKDFLPAAELIADSARAILLDLPGFGDSPRPDEAWGTEDYARFLRDLLVDELGITRFIWVGHSFGGRVGLRMASQPDSPIAELVIVAGAGVKRPMPWWRTLRSRLRSRWFKFKRDRAASEVERLALEKQYGSIDYVHSRETGMRDIFIKTVTEDQSTNVRRIACPTTLIYGARDTEAPPAIGRLLHALIPGSQYVECPEFNHESILTRGRHQIALILKEAIRREAV